MMRRLTMQAPLLLLLVVLLLCGVSSHGQIVNTSQTYDWRSTASEYFSRGSSKHSSNWAIIASTSIFWYNYRHTANALAVYRAVKEMGLDDDHIILMLADDHACNARNVFQGQVFSEPDHTYDLYGSDVLVDYRGRDATEQNLLRLLIGRHVDGTHRCSSTVATLMARSVTPPTGPRCCSATAAATCCSSCPATAATVF